MRRQVPLFIFALLFTVLRAAALQTSLPAKPLAEPPPSATANDAGSALAAAGRTFAAGHSDEALKQLDVLAAMTPEPPGVERLRGFIFYQQRNMVAAAAAYAKAVEQDPSDRESMQKRGVALYSLGRPAEAIPLLEKAHAAVASANVDPNYVLGVCYIA